MVPLRLASSLVRSSLSASPAAPLRCVPFTSLRCYSAKTQTLKETFAAKLPGEMDKIKQLRKSVRASLPASPH